MVPILAALLTFTNPIIPGFHPDPSVCRVGADYYLVNSSFEFFPGVPIFHSRDLVHWQPIGHVLTRSSQLDLTGVKSSGGIYAPTLRWADGRFYMITTLVGGPRGGGNFYVTATDPRGPWSDPVWLDKDGFDPSLLFADGKIYYQRDGKGRDFSHPQVVQTTLDGKTGKIEAPPKVIWPGAGGVWTEGAHVYKMGGRYYVLAAEGGTEYAHHENAGRAEAPFGPFEPFGRNPILTHRHRDGHPIQATGHADLVDLPDGTTWAVFLGIRPQTTRDGRFNHLGRETFLAPVRWTDDGWPIIGEKGDGTVELDLKAPPLPEQLFPAQPTRDDFSAKTLSAGWMFVRNPDAADLSLTERPGFVRLRGSAVTLDQVASPAAIVRAQELMRGRYRTELEFAPQMADEEAGLTVRASESNHYDLSVRLDATGRTREAVLTNRLAGVRAVVAHAPLPPGAVTLEIAADEAAYTFSVTAGAKTIALGALPTQGLSAEQIAKSGGNHFTGAVIGLYATGNGKRCTVPADFDWFERVPLP